MSLSNTPLVEEKTFLDNTSPKMVLIDASGFVFRAFYALPALTSPSGQPVNALLGFLRMLLTTINDHEFAVVAAVFDSGRSTFRHRLYPEYKSHRQKAPEELISQFALIHEGCDALGMPCVVPEDVEADDLLATYALEGQKAGYEVTIISGDKDLRQVVSPHVRLFDPLKKTITTMETLHELYQLPPHALVDVQALSGDASDGIPGAPGIGPKTALKLIQEYTSLDALFHHLNKVSPTRIQGILRDHEAQVRLSYDLALLRHDVPLPSPLKALEWQGLNHTAALALCKRYGLHSLERLFKPSLPSSPSQEALPSSLTVSPATPAEIDALHTSCTRQGTLYIYGDETRLYAWSGSVSCQALSFSWENLEGLDVLFQEPGLGKISYDMPLLLVKLSRHGLKKVKNMHDIRVMAYNLKGPTSELTPLSLGRLLSLIPESLNAQGESPLGNLALLPTLYQELKKALVQQSLWDIYDSLDRPFIAVLASMMIEGMSLDIGALDEARTHYTQQLEEIATQIYALAGQHFNIASPKQVSYILFDVLGLPSGKEGKSGLLSTSSAVLEKLSTHTHAPIAALILRWRHLHKLLTTYIDPLPAQLNLSTHRVHPHLSMVKTTTGRLSCADPNLQNIPIRTPEGRAIRRAFIAASGHQLITLDYSQIELRVVAHIAQEATLQQAFHQGHDIHQETAAALWADQEGNVTALQRRHAKAITFGILYGMSAYGLAQQLEISQEEAKRYIQAFFARYPKLLSYKETCIEQARKSGYVTTLWGRRCYITAHTSQEKDRQAINAPIQGTSADLMKQAMLKISYAIEKHHWPLRIIMQVHDEIVIEAPENLAQDVIEHVKSLMENVISLSVPLKVSIGVGINWDAAHGL